MMMRMGTSQRRRPAAVQPAEDALAAARAASFTQDTLHAGRRQPRHAWLDDYNAAIAEARAAATQSMWMTSGASGPAETPVRLSNSLAGHPAPVHGRAVEASMAGVRSFAEAEHRLEQAKHAAIAAVVAAGEASISRISASASSRQSIISYASSAERAPQTPTTPHVQLEELHAAVASGSASAVVRCLDSGRCDPNGLDRRGRTPMWLAACRGHGAVMVVLVEHGADADLACGGMTPAYAAAGTGRKDALWVLAQLGADMERPDARGITPLSIAAHQVFMPRRLRPLPPGSRSPFPSRLPLSVPDHSSHFRSLWLWCCVARQGRLSTVQLLLKLGVDVDRPSENGATPFWSACSAGNLAVVRALAGSGADAGRPSHQCSPREIACANGHVAVAQFIDSLARRAPLLADADNSAPADVPDARAAGAVPTSGQLATAGQNEVGATSSAPTVGPPTGAGFAGHEAPVVPYATGPPHSIAGSSHQLHNVSQGVSAQDQRRGVAGQSAENQQTTDSSVAAGPPRDMPTGSIQQPPHSVRPNPEPVALRTIAPPLDDACNTAPVEAVLDARIEATPRPVLQDEEGGADSSAPTGGPSTGATSTDLDAPAVAVSPQLALSAGGAHGIGTVPDHVQTAPPRVVLEQHRGQHTTASAPGQQAADVSTPASAWIGADGDSGAKVEASVSSRVA
jgi:ankyrin repeat protein